MFDSAWRDSNVNGEKLPVAHEKQFLAVSAARTAPNLRSWITATGHRRRENFGDRFRRGPNPWTGRRSSCRREISRHDRKIPDLLRPEMVCCSPATGTAMIALVLSL